LHLGSPGRCQVAHTRGPKKPTHQQLRRERYFDPPCQEELGGDANQDAWWGLCVGWVGSSSSGVFERQQQRTEQSRVSWRGYERRGGRVACCCSPELGWQVVLDVRGSLWAACAAACTRRVGACASLALSSSGAMSQQALTGDDEEHGICWRHSFSMGSLSRHCKLRSAALDTGSVWEQCFAPGALSPVSLSLLPL
jgi:hypothetical protein